MRLILKSALLTVTLTEVSITSVRESQVKRYFELLPSTSNDKIFESDKTIGRTFKLCGEMGVTTILPERGKIMGPPQLNE